MNIRKVLQWTFSVALIAILLSGNSRIDAQPQSGDWTVQTDFGEFVFTVIPAGTHISQFILTFSSYSCIAGITVSGTLIFSTPTGWPISNNQFNTELWIDYPNESMTITGTFSQTGDEASGTWSYYITGTICSSSWVAIAPVYVEEVGDGIPEQFLIAQNYPNPFNPTTTIRYEIPEVSFVTLKIYDILGSEVTTLVNDKKPAGEYKISFDGTGLPSGVYFYQFKAGPFIQTKKMILLK